MTRDDSNHPSHTGDVPACTYPKARKPRPTFGRLELLAHFQSLRTRKRIEHQGQTRCAPRRRPPVAPRGTGHQRCVKNNLT